MKNLNNPVYHILSFYHFDNHTDRNTIWTCLSLCNNCENNLAKWNQLKFEKNHQKKSFTTLDILMTNALVDITHLLFVVTCKNPPFKQKKRMALVLLFGHCNRAYLKSRQKMYLPPIHLYSKIQRLFRIVYVFVCTKTNSLCLCSSIKSTRNPFYALNRV